MDSYLTYCGVSFVQSLSELMEEILHLGGHVILLLLLIL